MEAVEDPAQKALLAEALLKETQPPTEDEVESSIQQIQERAIEGRLRMLRGLISEAERRADFAELAVLLKEKMELDKRLRELLRKGPGAA